MQVCERCGATIGRGGCRCEACGGEAPSASVASAPTAPDAESLLPLAEIKAKIRRQRFRSDGPRRWGRRCAFAGLALGAALPFLTLGYLFLTGQTHKNVMPVFEVVNWFLFAMVIYLLIGAGLGWSVGVTVWYGWSFVKPLFIALFFDPDKFEREYGPMSGPGKPAKGRRNSSTTPNEDIQP